MAGGLLAGDLHPSRAVQQLAVVFGTHGASGNSAG